MPQKKLLLNDAQKAASLAARIQKHRPGRQFTVYGLPVSKTYQVIEVRKFAGYGYTWDGTRWAKKHRPLPKAGAPALPRTPDVTVTVAFPLHQETKAYVGVLVNGKISWFGRGNICELTIDAGIATMTLPAKVAAKRGLAA